MVPAVGYLLYFYTYSTFEGRMVFMEDLYVSPSYRQQGIGRALVKALCEEALSKGCCRFDFNVLDWNEPSIRFYKNLGAVNMTSAHNWNLYRLSLDDMRKVAQS
ncbi:SAT2 [Cordylochernes scorpioides]|uniref:SAT2 n=1 Tax=Cordylochernes scorpioides TaxID=51811 RepID=A0ABY6KA13_9ARAC|nr:SAT2 [Cordylochernes scorpioides]